jgi:hypothetical protein
MILKELIKLLNSIKKAHPEAADADVRAINGEGAVSFIRYVGYDKRHKPARILLEE